MQLALQVKINFVKATFRTGVDVRLRMLRRGELKINRSTSWDRIEGKRVYSENDVLSSIETTKAVRNANELL